MIRDETIWLAGWLEGEGTFYFRPGELKHRGDYPRIHVQAFSTDQDVILRDCKITQGAMYYIKDRSPSRPGWRLSLEGDKAYDVMRQIRPFMCLRRAAKIDEAMNGWENRWNRPTEKLCACGCGEKFIGIPRNIYLNNTHIMRGYRARQRALKVSTNVRVLR